MDPFKKTKNDVAYLQYFISLFIYFILSAFIGSQGKKPWIKAKIVPSKRFGQCDLLGRF